LRELGLALLTSSWCLARFWGLVSNQMSSPPSPGLARIRPVAVAARRVHIPLLWNRILCKSELLWIPWRKIFTDPSTNEELLVFGSPSLPETPFYVGWFYMFLYVFFDIREI